LLSDGLRECNPPEVDVFEDSQLLGANQNLIYDVGMHRGEDTDYYLRKGYKVIGFEANPRLVEYCKTRFENAIKTGQLHIVEGAIAPSYYGNKVTFFQNSGNTVWGTIDPAWAARNVKLGYESETIILERVDIVESYRAFGIPHYLKIDIEGADRLVLEGLKEFYARPQYVSIESEKVDFFALRLEFLLFSQLGYSKFKVVQQASIPGKTFIIKTLDGRQFEYCFNSDASGPFGNDILQPWLTLDDALRYYKSIFRRYRLFGDHSLYIKSPYRVQRCIELFYKMVTGYRGKLPGWFDTHASL
jgi:FkbM family methyltransferase